MPDADKNSLWCTLRTIPRRVDLQVVEIDDPLEPGAKITAAIRGGDYLPAEYARKHINLAQFKAGRIIQKYYERGQIGALRSVDTSRDRIDGGKFEPLTETVLNAMQRIEPLEAALGTYGARLVRDVLAKGHTIEECAEARGKRSKHEIESVGVIFRWLLEMLAQELRLA